MKAKLVKLGNVRVLDVMRHGVWQPQHCPFSSGENRCGDWCPLFLEREGSRDPHILLSCAPGMPTFDFVEEVE